MTEVIEQMGIPEHIDDFKVHFRKLQLKSKDMCLNEIFESIILMLTFCKNVFSERYIMWTSRKEMIFSCMESLNTLMISRFISV
jgi:hypothetical protein